MKNFVKALKPNGEGFGYLKQLFPRITDAKIKEGIFVGPQIRQVLKDEVFPSKLSDLERAAWSSFKDLCTGFLGNNGSLIIEIKQVDFLSTIIPLVQECH